MNGKGKNAFTAVLIVVVFIFATCFALAACATGEDVQIEKVTSASEINRLIAKATAKAIILTGLCLDPTGTARPLAMQKIRWKLPMRLISI